MIRCYPEEKEPDKEKGDLTRDKKKMNELFAYRVDK